jgi:hypothetical protein
MTRGRHAVVTGKGKSQVSIERDDAHRHVRRPGASGQPLNRLVRASVVDDDQLDIGTRGPAIDPR